MCKTWFVNSNCCWQGIISIVTRNQRKKKHFLMLKVDQLWGRKPLFKKKDHLYWEWRVCPTFSCRSHHTCVWITGRAYRWQCQKPDEEKKKKCQKPEALEVSISLSLHNAISSPPVLLSPLFILSKLISLFMFTLGASLFMKYPLK